MSDRLTEYDDFIEYEGEDLFKDITEFKQKHDIQQISIFQLMLVFCEENNYDIEEIGDIVRTNKQFRNLLEADLKMNHEAFFKNDTKATNLGDWI